MSVGRYVLVLHSALRLWKVFYVLLSKTRTPGQGREVSRVSIVRGSVEAGTDSAQGNGTRSRIFIQMGYGFLRRVVLVNLKHDVLQYPKQSPPTLERDT